MAGFEVTPEAMDHVASALICDPWVNNCGPGCCEEADFFLELRESRIRFDQRSGLLREHRVLFVVPFR